MKLRSILLEVMNKNKDLSIIDSDPEYKEFSNWLYKFQTQKTRWVPPEYQKYKEIFDLVENKNYIAYRGLFFKNPDKNIKKLSVGNFIEDSGTSWSLNYKTAIQFARDDHHAFGGKPSWKEGTSIGIIISHTFSPNDILCDLTYMYKNGYKNVQYPAENEIVVFKNQLNCKIVEIMTKKSRLGKSFK